MSAKQYVLYSILLAVSLWPLAISATITPRVVGGQASALGQWPWMVALIENGADNYHGQFCGGSLISSTWVITAAHCVEKTQPSAIRVLAKVLNLKIDRGQLLAIKRIIMHPKYDTNSMVNDIALVQLQKPVNQAHVLPLVVGSSAFTHVMATVIGWGARTELDAQFSIFPEQLYHANLPIISNSLCKQVFGSGMIFDTMLCAGFPDARTDTCQGDSGGPLIIKQAGKWHLAGITSWGEGCAVPGSFGVYTRVSRYVNYIKAMLKTNFAAVADANHDSTINVRDKSKKNDELQAKFQTWVKQCWITQARCADVNVDGDINQKDYNKQAQRVAEDFKYWLSVFWLPEAHS